MRPKVIGIGLSKTGTSSLRAALEALGYRVGGPNKRLLRQVRSGDLNGVMASVDRHDAVEDFPYPLVFRELHQRYGCDARFILTRRRSSEAWYASICNHARTMRLFSTQRLAYGFYRPFGRRASYVELYERHNQAVRDYFAAHDAADQLLEVCWDEGHGWREVCSFIGAPAPDASFPVRNRADPRKFRLRRLINRAIEATYGLILAKLSERQEELRSGLESRAKPAPDKAP